MTSRNLERHYAVLDLPPGADAAQVKDAWRTLAKVWHPDRFEGDDRLVRTATEKLKQINEAYAVLREHGHRWSPPPPRPSPTGDRAQARPYRAGTRPPQPPSEPPTASATRRRWAVAFAAVFAIGAGALWAAPSDEPEPAVTPSEAVVAPVARSVVPAPPVASLTGEWRGRLNRDDETWAVELSVRSNGSRFVGTSRKEASDRAVTWAIEGWAEGGGVYLEEVNVLDERRPGTAEGAWCARAGWLTVAEDGRSLSGSLEAKGGRCPPATLLIYRTGEAEVNSALVPQAIAGTWEGEYTCGQGPTALVLDVQDAPSGLRASFSFGPHPDNPTFVPRGVYTMSGTLDLIGQTILLEGREWVQHPEPYFMVGLDGTVTQTPTGLRFDGRVLGDGCTTFRLVKVTRDGY